MVQFHAFEEQIQVNGTTIMAVVDGMGPFKKLAEDFFLLSGLPTPGKIESAIDSWYSQQKWLDVFKLISDKLGESILFLIGKKIPENAVFPSKIQTIEDGLRSIDVAYHMNHRNKEGEVLFDSSRNPGKIMLEGIGHYGFQQNKYEKKFVMVCKNPYPCDFDRGIITAIARKFEPAAVILHDDSQPCRKHGGDSCTYIIRRYCDQEAERQRLQKLRNNYFNALNHGLRTPLTQLRFGMEYLRHILSSDEEEVLDSLDRSISRLHMFVETAFANPINMLLGPWEQFDDE